MGKRKSDKIAPAQQGAPESTVQSTNQPNDPSSALITKKFKASKQTNQRKSQVDATKPPKAEEPEPIVERAGLPPHMSLFTLNTDVLLLIFSFITWYDVAVLARTFTNKSKHWELADNLLVHYMNRSFSSGLATLMKNTKNEVKSYTRDDVDWVIAQLSSSSYDPSRDYLAQGIATKSYSIPLGKIQELPHKLKPNPHYRRAAPMKLYKRLDVVRLCLERFGNPEHLEQYQSKLKERPVTRVEKRTAVLKAALAKIGLDMPNDNRLCQKFLSCSIAMANIDMVVQNVAQMKYCQEYSKEYRANLARLSAEMIRDCEELERSYDMYDDYIDYSLHYEYRGKWGGATLAERAAVGVHYPPVWPWLAHIKGSEALMVAGQSTASNEAAVSVAGVNAHHVTNTITG